MTRLWRGLPAMHLSTNGRLVKSPLANIVSFGAMIDRVSSESCVSRLHL